MLGIATNQTPGAYFEFFDAAPPGISAVRTDIAAFLGVAERGPVQTPTRIESWRQFQAVFGSFIASGYLAYAVNAFFQNGGRTCFVVRVADADAATAAADVIGRDTSPTFQVAAASPGGWGDTLAVRVGSASPAATRTSDTPQPWDGFSTLVESIGGFEPGALVRIFQEPPAPPDFYRVVTAIDPIELCLSWDLPLESVDPNRPLFLEVTEFSLTIYEEGRIEEVYSGLSLIQEHSRYLPRAFAERPSRLLVVHDPKPQSLTGGSPLLHPEHRLPALNLQHGGTEWVLPTGGADGLENLSALDFIGDPGSEELTGFRTLEPIDEVSIVAVPDCLLLPPDPLPPPPPPRPAPDDCLPCVEFLPVSAAPIGPRPAPERPPGFGEWEILRIQRGLVEHCESCGDRIALLDSPLRSPHGGLLDVGGVQAWRQRFESEFAALYYPWLLVDDPLRLGGEIVRPVPPSGHVAGLYARTDLTLGVHHAPANVELNWAQDVVLPVEAPTQAVLNPAGINCIRVFPARGIRVHGARTVSSHPDWRFVNVRRLMCMIEVALRHSMQWAVFEPADYHLRQTVKMSIGVFLQSLWRGGALAGSTPAEAYFVRCGEAENPPEVAAAGHLVAVVGVAPVRPAEYVVFRVGFTEDALEIAE